jgi:hypothetical protein
MPAVSYDSRSFQIDGKRVWLVSQTFEYFRYAPGQWPGMLKALKGEGFTGVNLPVPWALVEPSPGKFEFQGHLDIQRVVRLAGELGLMCILSPGPANLADTEFAGMPAWLLGLTGIKLRQVNPAFTSAVSRYLSALWEQVRDLQATSDTGPGASSKTGPILLVRLEADWTGHQAEDVPDYLAELARFHREDGCRVPLVLSNHLWHQVDTVISGWSAKKDSLSMGRQLGAVQPEAPRLFWDLEPDTGADKNHPGEKGTQVSPAHLAQALAGGVQVNLPDLRMSVDGLHAETAALLRFAGSFGFLFASLEPSHAVPVIHPSMALTQPGALSLVGQSGSQGDVLFLFGSTPKGAKKPGVPVMQVDGQDPEIVPGPAGIAWAVLDARLPGFGKPVTTTMSPLMWHLGRVLVVRAEHDGVVTVAGTQVHIAAATEKAPTVVNEQGLVIVGVCDAHVAKVWPVADGIVVGPSRLDALGNPDLSTTGKGAIHVGIDGKTKALKPGKALAAVSGPEAGAWRVASALEQVLSPEVFVKESTERTLEGVSRAAGAAWHQVSLTKPLKEQKLMAPEWGDDVGIYSGEGKLLGNVGKDGASFKAALTERLLVLSRRDGERGQAGWPYVRPRGLAGGLYVQGASSSPTVTQTPMPKLELWKLQAFVPLMHKLMVPRLHAYKVQFKTNAARVCVEWPVFEMVALAMVNGQFAGFISPLAGASGSRLVLHEGVGLKKGGNELVAIELVKTTIPQQVVSKKNAPVITDLGADVLTGAVIKGVACALPGDEMFGDPKKAKAKAGPAWFKCAVKAGVPGESVTVTIPELSAKEVIFNGKPVKSTGVESPAFRLDPSMFREDGVQELAVLSTDGKAPGKAKFG